MSRDNCIPSVNSNRCFKVMVIDNSNDYIFGNSNSTIGNSISNSNNIQSQILNVSNSN